jgi:hypothetical protein
MWPALPVAAVEQPAVEHDAPPTPVETTMAM